jgi:hypothetical protein
MAVALLLNPQRKKQETGAMTEPDPPPIRLLILAQDAAQRAHKVAVRINRRIKTPGAHEWATAAYDCPSIPAIGYSGILCVSKFTWLVERADSKGDG